MRKIKDKENLILIVLFSLFVVILIAGITAYFLLNKRKLDYNSFKKLDKDINEVLNLNENENKEIYLYYYSNKDNDLLFKNEMLNYLVNKGNSNNNLVYLINLDEDNNGINLNNINDKYIITTSPYLLIQKKYNKKKKIHTFNTKEKIDKFIKIENNIDYTNFKNIETHNINNLENDFLIYFYNNECINCKNNKIKILTYLNILKILENKKVYLCNINKKTKINIKGSEIEITNIPNLITCFNNEIKSYFGNEILTYIDNN